MRKGERHSPRTDQARGWEELPRSWNRHAWERGQQGEKVVIFNKTCRRI
jgi:hypothetical protein